MFQNTTIYITKIDHERLGNLIKRIRNQEDLANFAYIERLEEELENAEIVAPEEVPPEVVTMRSKVKLKDLDTGEEVIYSIVFPSEANAGEGKISILAPLVTALLGKKRGDTVEFQAPSRLRRLKIEKILYQPESAGEYNL